MRLFLLSIFVLMSSHALASSAGSWAFAVKSKFPFTMNVNVGANGAVTVTPNSVIKSATVTSKNVSDKRIKFSIRFASRKCLAGSTGTMTIALKDGKFKSGNWKGKCKTENGNARFSAKVGSGKKR